MGMVKFEVSAEVARAVDAVLKVANATGKVEGGFNKAASASDRMNRKLQQDARRTVDRVRNMTGSANLLLSQQDRSALRTGGVGAASGNLFSVGLQRNMMSRMLREQRAAAQAVYRQQVRNDVIGGHGLARMDAGMAAFSARFAAITDARRTGAFNAGAAAAVGGYGRTFDEDRHAARARRLVSRDVARMGIGAATSPQDMENMVGQRADRLRRGAEFQQRVGTGVLAVGAGVVGVASQIDQQLTRYADAITGFNRDMAPIYGVGNNMRSRGRIAGEVLSMTTGLGVDREQVIGNRMNIEAAASDIAPAVRDAIVRAASDFYKLQGSDMKSTGSAVNAVRYLTGQNSPRGVQRISNQLAYAADVGAFEVDQVTPYIGQVVGAFEGMGYGYEDALAGMVVASKGGARPEQYMTALRNSALLMPEAQKKLGRKLSPDFATAMGELMQVSGPQLLEMYGRDSYSAVKSMVDNAGEVQSLSKQLRGETGQGNVIGAKMAQAWTDPTYAASTAIDSARQVQANAPVMHMQNGAVFRDTVEEWEITKAGAELTGNPMLSFLNLPSAWIEQVMTGGKTPIARGSGRPQFRAGLEQLISSYQQSGQNAAAGYYQLKYGETTGTYWTDRGGNRQYSDAADAEAYAKLASEGYQMTAGQYQKYEEIGHFQGADAAGKYLARHKKSGAAAGGAAGPNPAAAIQQAGVLIQQAGKALAGGKNPATAGE